MEYLLNGILIAILVLIIGGVILYLYKAKKKGAGCVGCPYAKQCRAHGSGQPCSGDRCSSQCNCHSEATSPQNGTSPDQTNNDPSIS